MDWIQTIDERTYAWFHGVRGQSSSVHVLALEITALGSNVVAALVVLFALGLLLGLRRYRMAVLVLVSFLAAVAATEIAKRVVARPRGPDALDALGRRVLTGSFPSGHAVLSAAVYFTLALVAARFCPRRGVRVYLVTASLILALLVGVTRLYLGFHYVTDVVGGWIIGLALAGACHLANPRGRPG
jgi:undecaprenyl-diphosphatase